jgi:hypothetical protein
MSKKTILNFGIAFVILALVLIFLGVNYVPRVSASSSAAENVVVAGKQIRIDYIDEHYPRAIALPLSFVRSDWIERHPSNYYINSDWIERHPSQSSQ